MTPKERIVTFPDMGKEYSKVINESLENLGLKVLPPLKTTDKTIKLGVKYSPSMICIPFKLVLGNYIESLEQGANTLLMYDSKGTCRFRQYNHLHEFILKSEGYNFEMISARPYDFVRTLSNLTRKNKFIVLKELLKASRKIDEIDKKSLIWSKNNPNIGIIGELFCCCCESANFEIENKIRKFDCNPYNTARVGNFIKNKIIVLNIFKSFLRLDKLRKYKKEAKKYLQGYKAGHAYENLYNLLWLIDKKVDGIIHIEPLTCCPESTIEPYIDELCKKNKIPLLIMYIDENSAEANVETRIETFCEMISKQYQGGLKHE